MLGLGFRVQGCRVQGSGIRVLGFGLWGLGFLFEILLPRLQSTVLQGARFGGFGV